MRFVLTLLSHIGQYALRFDAYLYVDISGTETWFNQFDNGRSGILNNIDNMIWYVHPTEAGYAYIGRQLIAAIKNADAESSTDIVIDLNGMNASGITSVAVNGKPTTKFEVVDTYTLKIPYNRRDAVNVTVTAVNGTKLQVSTWQLCWHTCGGYDSYLISRTSDVMGLAKKTVTNFRKVIQSGISFLFGK